MLIKKDSGCGKIMEIKEEKTDERRKMEQKKIEDEVQEGN
jgi:hypothetical protein